ncbi:thiamine biosynthesis protein ApbE [Marinobacter lutaoensis]|jgi:thiamine biosynthesis lipoprotein|uniref:FAD:protein FMN transferase n=1 Tax=Marinobacter lutaoensis TaxID=135739 RepID=A0A1V2DW55_9GAMM|nr:FAD:protein FMN transferase [Marinobacter lutaoensis]ONF44501.1 thiamine biosynthesis protein ApbE [Marinobacter lutaoensis]
MRPVVFILFVISLAACSQQDRVQTLSGSAQGTTWHVTVWQPGGVDVATLQTRIQAEFDRLDRALSNYRTDSDIERFNAKKTIAPIEVGSEIVGLVEAAREISQASRGCYDLTIKPLFDLWGFSGQTLTPPEPATLVQQLQHVGFSKLETPTPTQLRKTDPQVHVDLSSIAQGYSVARIATVVEAAGVQNYLVEIGGELQTRGHKPDGSPWRIGVERPLPGGRSVQKALTIRQDAPVSVMTSGTYRHYFDEQGKRYSHVLDARTGRPVTHHTVSVTVINDNPTLADAWSTALLCLGREAGMTTADENGIAALFITTHNNQFEEAATHRWHSMKTIEVH